MSGQTAIEWTNSTWNPVTGCTKVSPGCANCYIERQTPMRVARRRFAAGELPVQLHPDRLKRLPPGPRVFTCSMGDLFHEDVPDDFIAAVLQTMTAAEHLTFQVLTKRPERMADLWDNPHFGLDHPNVWVGTSIENARFTWRAHMLRKISAKVRFISAEPLLGSLIAGGIGGTQAEREQTYDEYGPAVGIRRDLNVNVGRQPLDLAGIDWVICGGESGGRAARPMHPAWACELRDACLSSIERFAGVGAGSLVRRPAFFFKQWGSWAPTEARASCEILAVEPDGRACLNTQVLASPDTAWMAYAGASPKSGGKLLGGLEWHEFPDERRNV